ncbi:MAG: hypothetical protein AB8B99_00930 [Phormidesmis sp.]
MAPSNHPHHKLQHLWEWKIFTQGSTKSKLRHCVASGLSIALCMTGSGSQPAQEKGSHDIYPNIYPSRANRNRGHIPWTTGMTSEFRNRAFLRVVANQNEHIAAGSSAVSVSNGDSQIVTPSTVGVLLPIERFQALQTLPVIMTSLVKDLFQLDQKSSQTQNPYSEVMHSGAVHLDLFLNCLFPEVLEIANHLCSSSTFLTNSPA